MELRRMLSVAIERIRCLCGKVESTTDESMSSCLLLDSKSVLVPGLVSWKCMHCMQIREKMKRQKQPVKNLKIPLVLIDNDVIRENPDRPLNARHFCMGKDVVDAVLKRTKLQFYEEWAGYGDPFEVSLDRFSDTVLEAVPLDLDAVQKRQMKQSLDEKCERVMKKVLRKRKREVHNDCPRRSARMKRAVISHEYDTGDSRRSPNVVVSSCGSTADENEYVDVVGEVQDDDNLTV
ncbi:hypothetical protein KIN20_034435 [Parelaphostrongylus tenuis]|uniref:Uncharacterized protein n=1 Tax=Parelaphostrongylus tenuis TaxID=148309 RepID=A0AAD5WJ71_PARTN|nr:hypothetical protein KIN20_034435 [Parelaphostrongylus tenuis]